MKRADASLTEILLRLLDGKEADNASTDKTWGTDGFEKPVLKVPDCSSEEEAFWKKEIRDGWVVYVDGAPSLDCDACPSFVDAGRILVIENDDNDGEHRFEEDAYLAIFEAPNWLHLLEIWYGGPSTYRYFKSTRIRSLGALAELATLPVRSGEGGPKI